MSSILDKIVAHKKTEIIQRKELYPIKLLEQSIYYAAIPVSLKKYLLREDKSGIIAEIKRKSPSKGVINKHVSVERTSIGYMQAGASALSVLTDEQFFGGNNKDLQTARHFNFCPILRKDFMLDRYQIIESKSIGADVILLIAAVLDPRDLYELAKFTKEVTGMEVLMEVHSKEELDSHLNEYVDIVGVNNRNLSTFDVSIDNSIKLADLIPGDFIKISESGLSDPEAIVKLRSYGYQGFLVGEHFMTHGRPERACAEFIHRIKNLEKVA
jgi:indole-3-glycerol phosphate synthase